jgi:antibiotic biosynthesis monooxygenase (ABM) superfamily enzyme
MTRQNLKIHIVTTLLGWAVAFAIVYVILTLFGDELEAMSHTLNALIFTGIMVVIMGNFIMPPIDAAVTRYYETTKRKASK